MTDRSVYVVPSSVGNFIKRLAGRGINYVTGLIGCYELIINNVAGEDLN